MTHPTKETVMKKLILTAATAALVLSMIAPVSAMTLGKSGFVADSAVTEIDRRRPRVPGGSGCDSPRDIREHPECRP
jgi:hypothetical protein